MVSSLTRAGLVKVDDDDGDEGNEKSTSSFIHFFPVDALVSR